MMKNERRKTHCIIRKRRDLWKIKKFRSKTVELNSLIKEDSKHFYKTACVDHAMKYKHIFGWHKTEVLHKENNLRKRLALESL